MGMYDDIKFKIPCPVCGKQVSNFQSKDGRRMLATLDYWEVNNFYAFCDNCDTWVEYNRKKPRTPTPIEDYEMSMCVYTKKHPIGLNVN